MDLFFVLSGFLIGGILMGARDKEKFYSTFYLRRVHRIFPIYYVWIFLYVLIRVAVPEWIPKSLPIAANGIRHVPVYILFLQNWISQPFGTFDWFWFAITWSLAVEEQFYLLAPVLIRTLSRKSLIVTLCATVVLTPALRECVYRYTPHSDMYWYVLMPCRADSLAIGMLAAALWTNDASREFLKVKKRLVYGSVLFLSSGIPVLLKYFPGPTSHVAAVWGFSWLAFFYVAILLMVLVDSGGVLARAMRWRWLIRLGELSYCIYVIHLPIDGMLHAWLLRSSPSIATASGIAVTLLAAAITFGLAVLSWEYLETPMIRKGHRFRYGSWDRSSPALSALPGVGSSEAGSVAVR